MKVFLVSNMYPSKKNPGSGIFVKNFVTNFKDKDFEIVGKAVIKGISYNKIIQTLNYINLYLKIFLKGIFIKFDFIYVHNISHSTLGVFIIALLKNKTVVFNVHGTDFKSQNFINRTSRLIVDIMIKKNLVKAFIVPSDYFKKMVQERFKIEEKLVIVSPSGGIDLKIFNSSKKNDTELNFYDSEFYTLGYVSRIEENKGWKLFLNLVKKLNDSNIKCKGLIAGKGSDEEELNKQILKLNLTENIVYYGIVNPHKLANLYNCIDVFIFPTLYEESLGLVGIEAMACGTIVIGSNNEGIKSYIQDGRNGFLFETGNFEDLFRCTLDFYKLSDNKKNEMYKNAIQTAKSYDKDKVKTELLNRLKSLYDNEKK